MPQENDNGRGLWTPIPRFRSMSVRTKLMVLLIPSVVVILVITGYVTHVISARFIETALSRNARQHTLAMAHEVEGYLHDCRKDLLFIAQGDLDAQTLKDFLARRRNSGGPVYNELILVSPDNEGHAVLVAMDGEVLQVAQERFPDLRPNPYLLHDEIEGLAPGEVRALPLQEAEYPFPTRDNPNRVVSASLVRLITPLESPSGGRGFLSLAFDARELRNILSLYNSPQSPIRAVPRTDELRYAFMASPDGWILFQSEAVDRPDAELSTFLARGGFDGTLGRPGLAPAFRPDSLSTPFWRMIAEVNLGHQDCMLLEDSNQNSRDLDTYFFSYAPVSFVESGQRDPVIYAALAYVDRSKLALNASYKQLDVMFIITLATIAIITLIIFMISRLIANPILKLAKNVGEMNLAHAQPMELPASGFEIRMLSNAVNALINRMHEQVEVIRGKDMQIRAASLEQRADLSEGATHPSVFGHDALAKIVGTGPKVEELKSNILKAARVDVDVLIVGETGTGKQLAADAIHNLSERRDAECICINCGALDENLLLDTLFGHARGAFTEAKTERKGAFLEADGGTLFLDEIQSASLRVQQALLRAISVRKIKPLGSDRELDVNVRLIAATNVNLPSLIEQRQFREDLYFRLKVISLHTPPLREHKESIPSLALMYLHQAESLTGRRNLALSKGAIAKMQAYDWPGNVRELVNCITRAAVMVEGELIHARDLRLEGDFTSPAPEWNGRGRPAGDPDSGHRSRPPQESAPERRAGSSPPHAPEPGQDREPESAAEPVREAAPQAMDSADSEPADAWADAAAPYDPSDIPTAPEVPAADHTPPPGLSPRQRKAYAAIAAQGSISRNEYQEAVGNNLPARTANYDLNDMVAKGVLKKTGSGPSTRYVLVAGRAAGKS